MSLEQFAGARENLYPSEEDIKQMKELGERYFPSEPSTISFSGYLLKLGDFVNRANISTLAGYNDLMLMGKNPNYTPLVLTVNRYWNSVVRKDVDISHLGDTLQLRIRLIDRIIAKWNEKLLSAVGGWNDKTYDNLIHSPEYHDLGCISGVAGSIVAQGREAEETITRIKSIIVGKFSCIQRLDAALGQEIVDLFRNIPSGQVNLGIGIDDPESGRSYRLYPIIDADTILHLIDSRKKSSHTS